MAMRISPKRESPCTAPLEPIACPPSATTPMLMLALAAQVWKARKISSSHDAVAALAFNDWKRLLLRLPTPVPSGTKLSVRCPGFGQATPHCEGVSRSSSASRMSLRDFFAITDSQSLADQRSLDSVKSCSGEVFSCSGTETNAAYRGGLSPCRLGAAG